MGTKISFVRAKLRNPSQNNIPLGILFKAVVLYCVRLRIQRTYFLHIPCTPQAKQDLLLSTLPANSKKLVYMIQCKPCHKQYIVETKRRLKDCFNEHRRAVDKPTNVSKPSTVSEHFLADHHTADDFSLILLEVVHFNRDIVRRGREAQLITRGQHTSAFGFK